MGIIDYKQRPHSSLPSNNYKRTSQKDVILGETGESLIMSIRALLTQFTNIHHLRVMLNLK